MHGCMQEFFTGGVEGIIVGLKGGAHHYHCSPMPPRWVKPSLLSPRQCKFHRRSPIPHSSPAGTSCATVFLPPPTLAGTSRVATLLLPPCPPLAEVTSPLSYPSPAAVGASCAAALPPPHLPAASSSCCHSPTHHCCQRKSHCHSPAPCPPPLPQVTLPLSHLLLLQVAPLLSCPFRLGG